MIFEPILFGITGAAVKVSNENIIQESGKALTRQ